MLFKEYGEIDFLKKISKYSQVEKIGHDAAELSVTAGKIPIVTTDMLVEGIHFIPDRDSCFEIGFKSLAVNVSDIDAEGGIPKEALISLSINKDMELDYLDHFYTGLNEAAQYYGVKIIGGDLVNTKNGVVISITLIGEVEKELRLTRSGARPEDKIYLTGCLGESARNNYKISVDRLKNIGKKGRKIAQEKIATAMTDISDGLARSLYDLSMQSNVGFKVFTNKIPLAKEASLDNALNGGEDFELLFTSDKDVKEDYIYIGKVTNKNDIILVNEKGKEEKLRTFGYNQFSAI